MRDHVILPLETSGLPTFAEWRLAAYTETRSEPADGFVRQQTYPYPVGIIAAGMNTSDADRCGDEAPTANCSWWYGPAQTPAEAAQWKRADFQAVYVGFRCAYN